MDVLDYGNGNDQWDTLRIVLDRAKSSKLSTSEIVFLLAFGKQHASVLSTAVPRKPQSGCIYIFDTRNVRSYKKDLHEWKKKKGSTQAVREDHVKLKLNKQPRVIARHVHSMEVESFQRRSYSDCTCPTQHILVVHYLDVSNPAITHDIQCTCLACCLDQSLSTSERQTQNAQRNSSTQEAIRTNAIVQPKREASPGFTLDNDPFLWNHSDEQQNRVANYHHRKRDDDNIQQQTYFKTVNWDATDSIVPHFESDYIERFPDARRGGTKPMTLLQTTQRPRHGHTTSMGSLEMAHVNNDSMLDEIFLGEFPDNEAHIPSESPYRVVDFAPKSTTTSGGETFLIVLAPVQGSSWEAVGRLTQNGTKLRVSFGGEFVVAEEITPGVVRFLAPRCRAGATDIQLIRNGKLCANSATTKPMTVQVQRATSVLKKRMDDAVDHKWDMVGKEDEGDLPRHNSGGSSRVSKRKHTTSEGSATETKIVSILQNDDVAVDSLGEDEMLELSEMMFERVVRLLVDFANQETGLEAEIDALDSNGFNLLHYTIMYSRPKLVSTLLEFGADPNQKTRSGDTPLHLAAEIGSEEISSLLLSAPNIAAHIRDRNGMLPSQIASHLGRHSLAIQLSNYDGGDFSSLDTPVAHSSGLPLPPPLSISHTPDGTQTRNELGEYSTSGMQAESYTSASGFSQRTRTQSTSSTAMMGSSFGVASTESLSTCDTTQRARASSSTIMQQQLGETSDINSPYMIGTPRSTAASVEGGSTVTASSTPHSGIHDKHVKLLRDALGQMSLKDKMALTLSVADDRESHRASTAADSSPEPRVSSTTGFAVGVPPSRADDVRSIVSENEQSVRAAISVLGSEERQELEQEASIIQSNFRRWMLRKNFQDVRQATRRLQKFTKGFLSRRTGMSTGEEDFDCERNPKKPALSSVNENSAINIPQDDVPSMMPSSHRTILSHGLEDVQQQQHSSSSAVHNNNIGTKHSLSRRQFDGLKRQLSASLVIQKTVREHLNRKKQQDDFQLSLSTTKQERGHGMQQQSVYDETSCTNEDDEADMFDSIFR